MTLLSRLTERREASIIVSDLIKDFTPRVWPEDGDRKGVLIRFKTDNSDYDVRYNIYRGSNLLISGTEIAGEDSYRYYTDYSTVPGTAVDYYLEALKQSTPREYQVTRIVQYMPALAPRDARSATISVEPIGDGAERKVVLTWNFDSQKDPIYSPTGFEINSSVLSSPIRVKLDPFKYQYRKEFKYNAGEESSVSVTLTSYKESFIDGSGNRLPEPTRIYGTPETLTGSITEYFSMPLPEISFSSPAFIFSGLNYALVDGVRPGYTFDVEITVPDYDGLREVDGFEISAEGSNTFKSLTLVTPTATNTYSFTENNIPVNVVPVYHVRSYKDVVQDGESLRLFSEPISSSADTSNLTASYDIDYLRENPDADSESIVTFLDTIDTLIADVYSKGDNNTELPSGLGTPVLTIHYNGDNLENWILNEVGRLSIPLYDGSATAAVELPEEPEADALWKIGEIVYKYARNEDDEYEWVNLVDTLLDEQKSLNSLYILKLTENEEISYIQWDAATQSWLDYSYVFQRRMTAAIKAGLVAAYGSSVFPEVLTDIGTAEQADSFMLNTYTKYGLIPRAFDGPVIAFRGSPTAYIPDPENPFEEDLVPSSSRVRVGPETFQYGKLTGVERIVDVVAKINGVGRGFLADLIIDAPLSGGELAVEFGRLQYIGEMPSTSSLAVNREVIFEEYVTETNTDTSEIYYVGPIAAEYLSDFLSIHPDGITIKPDTTDLYRDRTADGGFIVRFGKLMARYEERARIRLLAPYSEDPTLPWYPRIDPGRFTTWNGATRVDYSLLEYGIQPWSAKFGAPYRHVLGERAEIQDGKTLRCSRRPLAVDHPEIIVTVNGNDWSDKVSDYDVENGLIFLSLELPTGSSAQVSYVYKELSYVYPFVNLNPSQQLGNEDLNGKFVAVFMTPVGSNEGSIDGMERTVFHRAFSSIEDIEAFLKDNDSFTTTNLFLVGYYHVNIGSVSDVEITDARKRGGGLRRDLNLARALTKNPGVTGYWDIGYYDGMPFPTTACLVKVPRYVLEYMTESEVLEAVSKHMALGVMPVIEYIDDQHIRHHDPDSRVIFPLRKDLTEPVFGTAYTEVFGLR